MDADCRGPGVPVLVRKNIIEAPLQGGYHPGMGIDGDVPLAEEKRADIVYPGRMVRMFVGKKDGVQTRNRVAQHLLPEVGAAIDDHRGIVPLNQYGYAQSGIARV